DEKLADLVWKSATARVGDAGKRVDKEIARVEKERAKAAASDKKAPKKKDGKNGHATGEHGFDERSEAMGGGAGGKAPRGIDPTRDPAVAPLVTEHTALLRLLGYLARPQSQTALVAQSAADRPRPVRFAAIAALRRIVAASEAKGTEAAIEALIEYADSDD